MADNVKRKMMLKSNICFIIVLAIIFLNVALMIIGGRYINENHNIQRDMAEFDLSDVDFDAGKSTYIAGDWEFYYSNLIISDKISSPQISSYLHVPSSWSGITGNSSDYDAGGFGSYRCVISGITATQPLTIYIPNIGCAYNVYVDGHIVSTSGIVSKYRNEIWTSATHESIPFTVEPGKEYEVVIEISSRNYSGLYMQPIIANYNSDTQYVSNMTALRFALVGIVAFCGILFSILRRFVNKSLYSVWLTILSFILFIRMIITTEGYAVTQPLFFNSSYEQMNVFVFASTFIIKLSSLAYFMSCLKIKVKENILVGFSFVSLLLAIGINFLPNSVFDVYYFLILQTCSVILDMYIVSKLCNEVANKTPYSFLYLLSYAFVVTGVTIDSLYTNGLIQFRCSSYMSVCFFVFVILTTIIHALRVKKMYSYAMERERLKNQLDTANMSIMLSQIQPHFLYNALNTIKSLIRREPKKAESAVIDFSLYLRGNMDSLSKTDPIVFKEELDHIKYYCNIEQLRFQDKLEVFYDIGPDMFYVPTLSVQPIVENAIKHGVTKRAEGGSVTISTDEDEKNYYIVIEDDGVGFNAETVFQTADKNRSHVGITNTKDRLEKIMGATVDIESKVGVGTKVHITLPKLKNVHTIQDSIELNGNKNIFREMEI